VPRQQWDDSKTGSIIGNLLRAGVLTAAFVVAVGGILYLTQNGSAPVSYRTFQSEPAELRSIPKILQGMAEFDSRAIIQLGLLLLIATPVLRVVFAIVAFYLEKDRLYIAVSSVVLAVLLFSLFRAA